MTTHDLKTWPGPFAALLDGSKTFEFRRDDRGFSVGDDLLLREWDPTTESYTGREMRRRISHLLVGGFFSFGVPHGFAVLSLAAPPSGTPGRGIAGRTPEEIARAFHDAYEALAPHFGYRTREASAKPWDEVPPSNRDLMIATVRAVLFEPIGTHPGPAPRPLAETPARCVTCGGSGYLPPTKTPTGATRNVMCPDCAPASRSGDPGATDDGACFGGECCAEALCVRHREETHYCGEAGEYCDDEWHTETVCRCDHAETGRHRAWCPASRNAAPPPASGDARTPESEP
jgi:hypothetical protein